MDNVISFPTPPVMEVNSGLTAEQLRAVMASSFRNEALHRFFDQVTDVPSDYWGAKVALVSSTVVDYKVEPTTPWAVCHNITLQDGTRFAFMYSGADDPLHRVHQHVPSLYFDWETFEAQLQSDYHRQIVTGLYQILVQDHRNRKLDFALDLHGNLRIGFTHYAKTFVILRLLEDEP